MHNVKGPYFMNKRNMIICAGKFIYENGGYLSRIISEIENIHDFYNIYLYIPDGNLSSINIAYIKGIFTYPYHGGGSLISYCTKIIECRKNFKKAIAAIDNPIVYCETLGASMWILDIAKKKKLPLVFDCHGTEADEMLMQPHSLKILIYSRILKHFEKYAVNYSSLIVTVSNKQYEKWKIDKNFVKYPMIPSQQFFDSNNYRNVIRQKLGLSDHSIVFIYCGGTAAWQMCEETIALYKRIENYYKNTFLIILSGEKDYFKNIVNKYEIKDYQIDSVKYSDVPKYLDASDYGFCIRANHVVNNVASPTKILEYLSRNVKPIITDCIGDFSEELGSLNLACIMNEKLDNIECIKKNEKFDGMSYVKHVSHIYQLNYINALKNI